VQIETFSENATEGLGLLVGRNLDQRMTILLQGGLGAGKSVFARGIARGLDVPATIPVTSPTFTLMNHYSARFDLYHFDLYRIVAAEELDEIGFDEFAFGAGVALIEWPERLDALDFAHLLVRIERLSASRRCLTFSAVGEVQTFFLTQLEEKLRLEENPDFRWFK
jgi:tRNA threonylcarbamoyladenosine biosynthesis protein TsaE